MIYPEKFEEKIGFDNIRLLLKKKCLSPLGERKVDEIGFVSDYEVVNHLLDLTYEFKQICVYEDDFPVDHYHDVTEALKKIKIEGRFLEVFELFELKKSLDTIKAVGSFLSGKEEKYPGLVNLWGKVKVYPYINERINRILTGHGKIKDNASKELHEIRRDVIQKQSVVTKRIQQILKKSQQEGLVDKEASASMRNGRPVIPVSTSNKRRIKGYIQDESSTGKTSFIEPVEVFELNNEIKELEYAEKREIIRILTSFSNDIRPYLEDLLYNYDLLGTLDIIRAKALLALELNATKPFLIAEPGIDWKEAVHPLLYLSHKRENLPVVPLSICLNEQDRIMIISGPNAGGKSVCLKTIGLNQYMLQCGLLIPLKENSKAGIFRGIFLDIGDEQSIENDLSTYSSHLLNMKFFCKNVDRQTLILIDEFGSGTEPNIGGALAEALLEKFNESGTFGVITTHYGNLKHVAASTEGIINGAMLFDTHKIQPLFQLLPGRPGSSFAFEIARKIGLQENILANASNKIGEDQVSFDKHLREILRDKRYYEKKRHHIRKLEKQLESALKRYENDLTDIKKLRKDILNDAKTKTDEIIAGINKKIENTIRVIRESNADKEKTKTARKKLDEVSRKVTEELVTDRSVVDKRLKQVHDRQNKISPAKTKEGQKRKKEVDESKIKVGDKVKMAGQGVMGEVLDINGESVMVAFGNMVTTLNEKRLFKVSENEYKKNKNRGGHELNDWNISKRKLKFKPDIDIRGKRADEALQIVTDFVDEACVVDAHELRILHGKGNGILRNMIRDYLNGLDIVKSCRDEHVEMGGAGITVVNLEY